MLDTNVVLDWLLFDNPSAALLAAAIAQRQVRWIATAAMRGELSEVLRRGLAGQRNADPTLVLAGWDAHAEMIDEPPRLPVAVALPCSDPDDQKFLDLAHWGRRPLAAEPRPRRAAIAAPGSDVRHRHR